MKMYDYVYLRDMQNGKKPEDINLFCETINGIYFVDSSDNRVILKTTDEGETVSTVRTRAGTEGVVCFYHDRPNKLLYFGDWENGVGLTVYKLEYDNSDTITSLGTLTVTATNPDIFIIGSSLYCVYTVVNQYIVEKYASGTTWNIDAFHATHTAYYDISPVVVIGNDAWFVSKTDTSPSQDNVVWKFDSTGPTLTSQKTFNVGSWVDLRTNYGHRALTYDGTDIISFALSDNKYYTYSISGDSVTQGATYNVALMLDRDTDDSNDEPFNLEKGIHITDKLVYQISKNKTPGQLYAVSDLATNPTVPTDIFISITDTYLITDDAQLYKYQDITENEEYGVSAVKINYELYKTTSALVKMKHNMGTSLIIMRLYDDSDNLLFIGPIVQKKYDGTIRSYECVSFDRELHVIKFSEDYTAQTSKQIMQDIIDDRCLFCYRSSSIDSNGDFTATYDMSIKNKFPNDVFVPLMDYEDGIYYAEPDGKVFAFEITQIPSTGQTINQGSAKIVSVPRIIQIQKQINRVVVYGAIVSGERLISTAEDLPSQQQSGIVEYVDYYPRIDNQSDLDTLATAILNRTGMADNPIYIDVSIDGIGFQQVGKTINFQFTPYEELVSAADYQILKLEYDLLDDVGHYRLSSGVVQEERERTTKWTKVSDADEEEIDILADKKLDYIESRADSQANASRIGDGTDYIDTYRTAANYMKILANNNLTLEGGRIDLIANNGDTYLYSNNVARVRINASGGHTHPQAGNSYDLGLSGAPWRTVYYHALSDQTCASFKDRSVENLVEMLTWNHHEKIFHEAPMNGNLFPHIDMGSVHNELAVIAEEDMETEGVKDEFEEYTKIPYKKGEKCGIDFGTMVYALKDLVLKQNQLINDLEKRIEKLEKQ